MRVNPRRRASRARGVGTRSLRPLFSGLAERLAGLGLDSRFLPLAPPLDFLLPFACHLSSLFAVALTRPVLLVQRHRPFHLRSGVETHSGRSCVRFALAGPVFHIDIVVARVKFEAMLTAGIALRDFGLRAAPKYDHASRVVER